MNFSKAFWQDTAERAIRTVAQTALSIITINGTPALSVDWTGLLYTSALAGVISILMSVVASGSGNKNDASFVK